MRNAESSKHNKFKHFLRFNFINDCIIQLKRLINTNRKVKIQIHLNKQNKIKKKTKNQQFDQKLTILAINPFIVLFANTLRSAISPLRVQARASSFQKTRHTALSHVQNNAFALVAFSSVV